MSFGLKWVSCKQHMYRSFFVIHSATVCLLIGTLNPFAFKVIINWYVAIYILLYICLIFFSYWGRPFNISYKTGLVVINSFTFFLSGKFFTCHSTLMTVLLGRVILITGLCFSLFDCFMPNISGLQNFCWEITWQSYGSSLVGSLTALCCCF